jgi:hypothetical protein
MNSESNFLSIFFCLYLKLREYINFSTKKIERKRKTIYKFKILIYSKQENKQKYCKSKNKLKKILI